MKDGQPIPTTMPPRLKSCIIYIVTASSPELPPLDEVVRVDPKRLVLLRDDLDGPHQSLLALVDGKRTLQDILTASELPNNEAQLALSEFFAGGLLTRLTTRSMAVTSPAVTPIPRTTAAANSQELPR